MYVFTSRELLKLREIFTDLNEKSASATVDKENEKLLKAIELMENFRGPVEIESHFRD